MKTVYFVRHGESEANAGGIRRGAATPLTLKGKEEADKIARRCAHLSFETIIASPWARTKETAAAIAKYTGKPLEYSDLFVEWRRPSAQEGKTKDDPEAKRIEKETRAHIGGDWRHSDEETFNEMNERARQCLTFLEKRQETNLLVVGHGIFMRAIVGRVLFGDTFTGQEFRALYEGTCMSNTGISVLRFREKEDLLRWEMLMWNDHAHLG